MSGGSDPVQPDTEWEQQDCLHCLIMAVIRDWLARNAHREKAGTVMLHRLAEAHAEAIVCVTRSDTEQVVLGHSLMDLANLTAAKAADRPTQTAALASGQAAGKRRLH